MLGSLFPLLRVSGKNPSLYITRSFSSWSEFGTNTREPPATGQMQCFIFCKFFAKNRDRTAITRMKQRRERNTPPAWQPNEQTKSNLHPNTEPKFNHYLRSNSFKGHTTAILSNVRERILNLTPSADSFPSSSRHYYRLNHVELGFSHRNSSSFSMSSRE